MRGYIEVSKNDVITNSSRPGGVMESCHTSVKYGGVKKATRILKKHRAVFSHYVDSVRNGPIAIYVLDDNNVYMSFRLKNYPHETLARIQQNLTTI